MAKAKVKTVGEVLETMKPNGQLEMLLMYVLTKPQLKTKTFHEFVTTMRGEPATSLMLALGNVARKFGEASEEMISTIATYAEHLEGGGTTLFVDFLKGLEGQPSTAVADAGPESAPAGLTSPGDKEVANTIATNVGESTPQDLPFETPAATTPPASTPATTTPPPAADAPEFEVPTVVVPATVWDAAMNLLNMKTPYTGNDVDGGPAGPTSILLELANYQYEDGFIIYVNVANGEHGPWLDTYLEEPGAENFIEGTPIQTEGIPSLVSIDHNGETFEVALKREETAAQRPVRRPRPK